MPAARTALPSKHTHFPEPTASLSAPFPPLKRPQWPLLIATPVPLLSTLLSAPPAPFPLRLLPTAAPLHQAGSWPAVGGTTSTWVGRPIAGLRCNWWSSGSSRSGPSTSCPRSIGRDRTGRVGGSGSCAELRPCQHPHPLLLLGRMRQQQQQGTPLSLCRHRRQRRVAGPGCRRCLQREEPAAVGPGCGWGTAAAECCTWCTTGSASMSKW